jgi:putative nucleotidyltransferase with HDIG domain
VTPAHATGPANAPSSLARSVPAALEPLLRHTLTALDVTAAAVLLGRAGGERPCVVAASGAGAHVSSAQAALAGRAMQLDETCQRTDTGFAATAPLRRADGVFGALWVGATDARAPLLDDELRLLAGLAAIAAATFEPATPPPTARMATGVGIDAMAGLLNLRDGYAAADAEEMVRLAGDIGRRLAMPVEQRTELAAAARLHDIGKIAVPDRILHKRDALDAGERLVMQRHAVWGAETLARTPGLERVAEIVRSHHERWDGTGYPSGIAGEDIPLASRIIGACEAFRAMTSERPYRRSVQRGQALSLVAAAAGSHFDPAVARALVAQLAEQGVTPDALDRPEQQVPRTGGRAAATGDQRASAGYGRHMAKALERLDALPALTESRDRLLALLDTERPSVAAIVSTVESDLALVISVLRLANQHSRGRGRIATVPDAVAALTPEGVEMLASRIAVVDFFEHAPGWGVPPEQVRLHAIAVQRAADRIAREAGWRNRDELLVAALLHDIGKLVLTDASPGYPEQVHGGARTPDERIRAERHALGLDHADVGGVLLRRWRLPESIAQAVEHHHDPETHHPAAAVVRLADMLAHHSHGDPIDRDRLLPAAETIGLSAQQLRSLIYELPADSATERRLTEPSPLTVKEQDVMRLLASGMVYKEIGAELGLSASTVRTHLHNVYKRLGVGDRAQAVLKCAEAGWL